ncbi:YoaK family protein [Notoacmeibacter sp. MSK16QG-6]|uniref:YoaK family protein n=1 Tax=Notoacmeibacter sp. MSK16QG-6 TaxID=2957982 RepID=UPI0020A15A57|nr:YoaK family protein [Notoacmeibacter sp. MSK16QG-6]MCP1200007.1 YoaK family protein [Notoacmeibacter sp. MSK16QG-6]
MLWPSNRLRRARRPDGDWRLVTEEGQTGQAATVGLLLIFIISSLAGMIDAIGLILSQNFVSFMTGNTTRLATSFGEGDYGRIAVLATYLVTFVMGNAAGIVIVETTKRQWPCLLTVAALLSLSAILGPAVWALLPTVFAMGAINATMEQAAGYRLSLTYVTGALSRLGKGIGFFLMGQSRRGIWKETVPWFGMVSGAGVGTLLTVWLDSKALWPPVLYCCLIAAATAALPSRWTMSFLNRS